MLTKIEIEAATKLASRLNYLPLAVVGLWLAPVIHFWFQAFAPAQALRSFDWAPPAMSPDPWFVSAALVGLFALALPRSWYEPRQFETRLFGWLGVRHFRRLATNGDVIIRAVRRRYPSYTVHRGRLDQVLANTVVGEKSHTALFLFGTITSAYTIAMGWEGWAVWSTVTNIIGNLYPLLLQRYTRDRLAKFGIRLKGG